MSYTDIVSLILSMLVQWGLAVLTIITAVIGIGLAYLVFRFGWKRVMSDKSLEVFGFYLRNTPYAGYNRFRSKEWNMKHTM